MFITLFVCAPSWWQLEIIVDVLYIYMALLLILLILGVMHPFQYWKGIILISLGCIAMFAVQDFTVQDGKS